MAFKVGMPVESTDFIDREKELATLLHFLADNQNVMIHAPRRYGKTSLIMESFRQYGGNTIYFDLKRYTDLAVIGRELIEKAYAIAGIDNFWDNLRQSITKFLKSLRTKASLKLFKIIEVSIEKIEHLEQNNANKDEMFLYALDFVEKIAQGTNKKIVIALDEFQDIGLSLSNDLRILDKIRAVVQHHKNITYIFCGSHQSLMTRIFFSKASPFFHFCRIIELSYLDLKALVSYVKMQFAHINVFINEDDLAIYLQQLDCHPYYSIKTMQVLYYYVLDNKIHTIGPEDFKQAVKQSLYETKSYLDEMLGQIKLRAHHFEMLLAVANNKIIDNLDAVASYKVKQSLVETGYLRHMAKGEYIFADTFLKYYLRDNFFA